MLFISLLSFVFAIAVHSGQCLAADPTTNVTLEPDDNDMTITPVSNLSMTTISEPNESSTVSTELQTNPSTNVSTSTPLIPTTTDMLDGSGDGTEALFPDDNTTSIEIPSSQVAPSSTTTITSIPPFTSSATLLMFPTNTPVTLAVTETTDDPTSSSYDSPAEPSQDPNLNDETAKIGAAIGVASFVLVTLIVILCGLICCYHMFK